MSAAVARRAEGDRLNFRCPGCNEAHSVNIGSSGASRWQWNGDIVRPTLMPSLLVRSGHYVSDHRPGVDRCWCDYNRENPGNPAPFSCAVCHSFIREGMIQFLPDCSHALAGQTVALPPWGEA